jgi:hypothetical protein
MTSGGTTDSEPELTGELHAQVLDREGRLAFVDCDSWWGEARTRLPLFN